MIQSPHFKSLTDESGIATFIFDIGNKEIIYKNRAFSILFPGCGEAEIPGKLWDFVHADDHEYARKCFDDLLQGTLKKEIHLRIAHENERRQWVRAMPSMYTDSEGRSFIHCHIIDVTAELINEHTFAKYANKKNSILNILAHELAGSLSIARTLSSKLKSDVLGETHNKLVDHVMQINREAVELIRDLTSREFLETANVVLTKKRVDVARKLAEYIEEAKNAERKIKRTITFNASPKRVHLSIDESKFMQVINNLMSNALKFTTENGIIAFKVEDKGDSVLFTVSDNGIGIPKKHHAVLFDQYTSAGRPGLQGEASTGLGMSVVKNIVEWHQGTIWFESELGNGTTFYIEIPREAP
ncbi:PAS domain-containing sensor histidine kinase [Pedobacter faecalis]|uniref:PAS domain-containing sensor histidine kinase n=1 Tax=Pedobacter faecalis TaxID=3041495 RepID=UPI00254C1281|nr:PAS domain-containing sensor histidine kinase [Pedobacter sp. ELA7]